jgi:Spy/CpxP family protein refolding chaperone
MYPWIECATAATREYSVVPLSLHSFTHAGHTLTRHRPTLRAVDAAAPLNFNRKEIVMKKSIKTLMIATAIAGSVAAGLAYAMPPGGGGRCPDGGRGMGFGQHGMDADAHVDRMAERLDLNKEQRDKVRAIVDKTRPQARELRDKLSENRKQMQTLTRQGTTKESEIRKLADNQGKLIADMIVQRSKVQGEINTVLTPEQREKMQQRFENRGRFPLSGQRGGQGEMAEGT